MQGISLKQQLPTILFFFENVGENCKNDAVVKQLNVCMLNDVYYGYVLLSVPWVGFSMNVQYT